MADLPEGVLANILAESAGAHSQLMIETRGNIQTSNQYLRQSAAKKFDEIGAGESRANSGVLATPIGQPTTTS